jgi:hypothetical protein
MTLVKGFQTNGEKGSGKGRKVEGLGEGGRGREGGDKTVERGKGGQGRGKSAGGIRNVNKEYLDLVGRSALLDLDSCLAVDAGRAAEGRRHVAARAALKICRI